MRLNETITQLDDVIETLELTNFIIQSYTALDVPSIGVVSDVTVIFPCGRDYTAACQTQLAAFMPVYEFVAYEEKYNSSLPVALSGLLFRFRWTDSSGGI